MLVADVSMRCPRLLLSLCPSRTEEHNKAELARSIYGVAMESQLSYLREYLALTSVGVWKCEPDQSNFSDTSRSVKGLAAP
jgi:hypothetical protein